MGIRNLFRRKSSRKATKEAKDPKTPAMEEVGGVGEDGVGEDGGDFHSHLIVLF
jgi:hypothetical protein